MMNFQFHLREFKFRVFYLILSAIFTFLLCYHFRLELIYLWGKPFMESQQTFVFFELTEAFYTCVKISTMVTLIANALFFIYHIWSFCVPSLYTSERTKMMTNGRVYLFFLTSFLVWSGLVLLPKMCDFLISFEITSTISPKALNLQPLLCVEYTARFGASVKLISQFLTIMFGVLQLPVVIWICYSKKLLDVSSLYGHRKILGVIGVLISAFLAPPDVLSQIALSVLFFVFFELVILTGLFFELSFFEKNAKNGWK